MVLDVEISILDCDVEILLVLTSWIVDEELVELLDKVDEVEIPPVVLGTSRLVEERLVLLCDVVVGSA